MPVEQIDRRGLLEALFGDGRFLVIVTGLCLVLTGVFAVFQSTTGHFLPHDIDYLGMTSDELCGLNECRIVHFMFHDRVSFGGVLVAIGALYIWLAEFPLRQRLAWAWWTLFVSGGVGFASFLAYLGYGYLDTWHGAATMLLLPVFVVGLVRSWRTLHEPRGIAVLWTAAVPLTLRTQLGWGRLGLLIAALGITGAGITITTVGMTTVFVPQDLEFMGVTAEFLQAVNPRLVPLIAHDRAGFGGGLCSVGVAMFLTIWCARPSRNLWEILALVGCAGFAAAIGVHFVIGYEDVVHLAPACLGGLLYAVALGLSFRPMMTA